MARERAQLRIGEIVFGGEKYLMCVPLVSKTMDRLVEDATAAMKFAPDLFEWRADHFEAYPEPEAILAGLQALRTAIGNIPILFTTRHFLEDGASDISDSQKFGLIDHISNTGMVELIDIEQRYGPECLLAWSRKLHSRGIRLIISHHNFKRKMNRTEILKVLQAGQDWGADINKMIVKASSFSELADFSDVIHEARNSFLKIPVIAGVVGKASPLMRVLGDYLGSDMTFVAAGDSRSHTSQIHINEMRRFRDRIHLSQ
ncbi:type I 3-dehydroquinate dehydratase [Paenibacillus sp. FSL H8-0122]|uniref:type I 3-dehydroquinate dehydratase n=1 Tax=Paenibacillus sp. FSL H8-0122 TaxID=2954510 RepID=UPI0030FA81AB